MGFVVRLYLPTPATRGLYSPIRREGGRDFFNGVLDRAVYFDCVVQDFDTIAHASGDVRNKGG
jgi:hypothetical protein